MKHIKRVLFWILVSLFMIYILFPVYWLINSSFKLEKEIFSFNPTFYPHKFIYNNYRTVLFMREGGVNFMAYFSNSLIIAITVLILSIFIGGLAAYGMSRSKSRAVYILPLIFLAFSLTPPQAYVNPLYLMMKYLNLLDTKLGLIIIYLLFSLPLPIWFLSQYFKGIPKELEEVAKIDGCTRLQVMSKIVLPLSAPGIFTSAIFVFMYVWNEYFLAGIFTSTPRAMTLPIGIMNFQQAHSVSWNLTTAASMLAVFPLVIVISIFQRYIVQALMAGALKG
jgi:multiple sugar transport system permease protein